MWKAEEKESDKDEERSSEEEDRAVKTNGFGCGVKVEVHRAVAFLHFLLSKSAMFESEHYVEPEWKQLEEREDQDGGDEFGSGDVFVDEDYCDCTYL